MLIRGTVQLQACTEDECKLDAIAGRSISEAFYSGRKERAKASSSFFHSSIFPSRMHAKKKNENVKTDYSIVHTLCFVHIEESYYRDYLCFLPNWLFHLTKYIITLRLMGGVCFTHLILFTSLVQY